jgi:hypothetical protein
LAQACVAYKQLMGRFTPETFVFAQLFYVQDDYQPFRLSGIAAEIAAADPSERKNLCLQIIERIKGEAVEG